MSGYTWPDILTGLVRREGLEASAATWALNEIFAGRASEVQVAALLTALRAKGESEDEIAGLAGAMLANAAPIALDPDAVDIVGTGGDRANTVNISTMAAIVAAGAGAKVVKHGARAASSMAGTADTLEALGVKIDLDPARQPEVLDEVGIVFLFAQLYHPAMKNVAAVRRQLGIQTTFNFLGPLANPARPRAMALGVANDDIAPVVARVLAERGDRVGLALAATPGDEEPRAGDLLENSRDRGREDGQALARLVEAAEESDRRAFGRPGPARVRLGVRERLDVHAVGDHDGVTAEVLGRRPAGVLRDGDAGIDLLEARPYERVGDLEGA